MPEFWASAIAGACGGFSLGLVLLTLNAVDIHRNATASPRIGQLVASQLCVALVLALLGGLCAFFLTGSAGDFLMGVTALGFILLASGNILSSSESKGEVGARSTN